MNIISQNVIFSLYFLSSYLYTHTNPVAFWMLPVEVYSTGEQILHWQPSGIQLKIRLIFLQIIVPFIYVIQPQPFCVLDDPILAG